MTEKGFTIDSGEETDSGEEAWDENVSGEEA
jgi:hypothetical protein